MPFPQEFIRWVRAHQAELRAQLTELESGRRRVSRAEGALLVDISTEEAARLRRQIANLQYVLDKDEAD